MNDHDVIDSLRTALGDVHHERPLAQVARRARVVKARRRAPGIAAAVLVAAGALSVATQVSAPGSAFADWTSVPQTADPTVAEAIDASCREMAGLLGFGMGADDELLLLDVRGEHAVALYRTAAGGIWDCSRLQGAGGPGDAGWWTQGGGGGASPVDPPSAQRPIVVAGVSGTWNASAGEMSMLYGRVAPGASRVEVRVPGSTVTAAMADGYFEAWWPSVSAQSGEAIVTAYDAAGAVIASTTREVAGFGV